MAERKLTAIKGGRPAKAAPRAPAKPTRPKTLQQAIASGDKLAELEALRLGAARRLSDPKTSARDWGTLSKQIGEWGAQIAALKTTTAESSGTGAEVPDDADDADEDWDPEAI